MYNFLPRFISFKLSGSQEETKVGHFLYYRCLGCLRNGRIAANFLSVINRWTYSPRSCLVQSSQIGENLSLNYFARWRVRGKNTRFERVYFWWIRKLKWRLWNEINEDVYFFAVRSYWNFLLHVFESFISRMNR